MVLVAYKMCLAFDAWFLWHTKCVLLLTHGSYGIQDVLKKVWVASDLWFLWPIRCVLLLTHGSDGIQNVSCF